MKVNIGPHRNYISVYTLVEPLSFLGEEKTIKIATWLSTTWVAKFLKWLDSKRKRTIKVEIHDYDTWNLDKTLAYIILPSLKKFKNSKYGMFLVDNSDVPKEYRNQEQDDDDYEFAEKKFNWVIDEIIWAFEQIIDENSTDKFYIMDDSEEKFVSIDHKGLKEHDRRLERALKLFGKYYQSLWD